MGRIGNSGLAALTLSTAFAACNVLDFGARGDGITIDTLPIRAAVSACAGSALIFPAPHVFLTGPQNLSSDSSYIIEDGAMIKAIPGPADWPIAAGLPSYAPDYWRYQPFLWAYDQRNVSVSGGGAIDGSGATYWWPAWFNGSLVDPLVMHRPYLLETYNCTDVSVVGISLSNSPFWTVHPYVSSRIELRGLSIYAPVGSPNTDGIDPDSSSYVTIADTTIENGDDCIAIKSGRGSPGAAFAQASHHITVTNLTLLSGLGVTLGAEAAGGVHDVLVSGVTTHSVLAPVHLQNPRWHDPTWAEGGTLENITYENYVIANAHTAIYINLFWGDIEGTGNGPFPSGVTPAPAPNATTPHLRNITIRNIAGASLRPGIDTYMVGNLQCPPEAGCSGVTLSNISIAGYKTWSCANIADVRVDPPGSVSPDPSLYGCVGNASVVSPAYHASNFQ